MDGVTPGMVVGASTESLVDYCSFINTQIYTKKNHYFYSGVHKTEYAPLQKDKEYDSLSVNQHMKCLYI